MNKTIGLGIFAACFSLWGCSGSKGSSGKKPKNSAEAIAKLPEANQKMLASWKQRIVKSCDASEALGLDDDDNSSSKGIDGAMLIKKNAGSMIFADNDSLAVVTSYNTIPGYGSTIADESVTVNGKGYEIKGETKRSGSTCELYLYGQKIHETFIVQNLIVGTQWTIGKDAKSISRPPQVHQIGAGASEVSAQGIFSLIEATFKPTTSAIAVISKKLGISENLGSTLIKLSQYTSADSAVQISDEPTTVWSNREGGNLIAKQEVLDTIFSGANRTLALDIRLGIPQFDINGVRNTADNGNLKMSLKIDISKQEEDFLFATKEVELQGLAPFNEKEAIDCSRSRVDAYIGHSGATGLIRPSVGVMFSPCRTFHHDIVNLSYKNGLMASLIPTIFADVIPERNYNYGGWDDVLSKLSLEYLQQGKDILELDPQVKTVIVGVIAGHLTAIKEELANTPHIRQSSEDALNMGLKWSFLGEIVSSQTIVDILQAIDNSVTPFKASSIRLMADLGTNPNGLHTELAFALGIDDEYRDAALAALKLSRELTYSDFELVVFNLVIQKQTSLEELRDWTHRLGGIQDEMKKYPNLGSEKNALVGLSVKLLRESQATLAELGAIFAAVHNALNPFENSTKQLVKDLARSHRGEHSAVDFAKTLTPEYKKLAVAIRNHSKSAEFKSWGEAFFNTILQKRPTLVEVKAYDHLWVSALAFTKREKARLAGEFGSSGDWNRKDVLEVAIKEVWSNNEFTSLEIISEVAKAKSMCERYKDTSTLADCAGLSLFSKTEHKFFDPAFAGRYAPFAKDFNGYMKKLSGFDWYSLRSTLLAEFFGSSEPIWSKCDNNLFKQKAATLKVQIGKILRTTDQIETWELERKIKETIENCI